MQIQKKLKEIKCQEILKFTKTVFQNKKKRDIPRP